MVSFHELTDSAQKQYADTMHQHYIEQHKENRDENLILKLRADLREPGLYIIKLGDTTPVILQIRKLLSDRKYNSKLELNSEISMFFNSISLLLQFSNNDFCIHIEIKC